MGIACDSLSRIVLVGIPVTVQELLSHKERHLQVSIFSSARGSSLNMAQQLTCGGLISPNTALIRQNQDMRDSVTENSLLGLTHVTATGLPYAAGGDLKLSPDISGTGFRDFWSCRQRAFQKVSICALGIPNGIRVTMLVFDEHLNPEYRTIRSAPEGLFMEK